MSNINGRSYAEVEEVAKSKGLIMINPLPHELTLDVDSPEQIFNADVLAAICSNGYSQRGMLWTRSVSGNWHLWIRLSLPMDPITRVAFQAALGSDPLREILSVIRIRSNAEVSSTVFETPEGSKAVQEWRSQF